jgi:hypothetical protein
MVEQVIRWRQCTVPSVWHLFLLPISHTIADAYRTEHNFRSDLFYHSIHVPIH